MPGFDEGSPDGHDPLIIARQMAARGITLVSTAARPRISALTSRTQFFVACEPALSGYSVRLTTSLTVYAKC